MHLPFLKPMGPFATYDQTIQQARQLQQDRGWNDWQQAIFAAAVELKPDGT